MILYMEEKKQQFNNKIMKEWQQMIIIRAERTNYNLQTGYRIQNLGTLS